LFEVANTNNTTDAVDIGYYGRYYDSVQERVEFTGLFRDASDAGKFKIFTGLVDEPTNVVNTTGTGYTVATLVANVDGNLNGTANAANILSTARTIAASGDATWSVSFNGSANVSSALTLANTGVTATTYGTSTAVPTIAVDSKGRITSASNTNITFPVTSVNGAGGTVVLTTTNIAEGSNQYFTTGRVSAYLTGAISTVLTADLTASRAVASNASGKLVSSGTTDTELGYLSGVTSAVQTQLNSKLNLSGGTLTGGLSGTTGTFSGILTTPQVKAATSAGLSINANSGTQVADFGAGGSANITFFGGLAGTSATFSSFVDGIGLRATSSSAFGGAGVGVEVGYSGGLGYVQAYNRSTSTYQTMKVDGSTVSLNINGTAVLSIASNSAATFSSSVRANAASTIYGATQDAIQTIFTLGGQNASAQAKELYFRLTASGTPQWTLQTASVGTDADINIYPSGANGLKIAYSGAATFSSSIDVSTTARFQSSSNWMQFEQNVLTSQNNDGAHIRSVVSADSAPTYSWKGDSNTGMFTPSADTIGFSTGGAERMRIASSSNILIGTQTDTGEKLSVSGITYSSDGFRNAVGSVTLANNTQTTIYTSTGARGLYTVYVSLPAGDGAIANYSAYAIIAWDTGASRIMQQTDGLNLYITLSGNNIQARQTSGATQSITYRIFKMV
jgi:hypothetical protein